MKTTIPTSFQFSRRTLLAGGTAAAALSLLGCGGGSDFAGVGSGGTGSFSSGPIRGFGSIVVGGVHYDETAAQIVGDGGGALASGDLRLGMVVEVSGSEVATGADGKRRATATAVGVRSEIEGPVSAIDLAQGRLTVLGQQVQVTASTVFDDDLRGGLASLRVGQIVEIYGLQQADGSYTATRIDDEDDARWYKLRGLVSGLDAAAQTFRIGTTVVSYAEVAAAAPGLADGRYVRVELHTTVGAGGVWRAAKIQVQGAGVGLPPDGDAAGAKVEIEGYITAFTSSVRFSVSGVPVDASGVTRLPAGLALGQRVEVEGVLANAVLIAREVELEDDDDDDDGDRGGEFEVEGRITQLDTARQTFVVRGITVDYSQARFEDGTAEQLAVGVKVEVEGRLAADGTTLLATEIEFDD